MRKGAYTSHGKLSRWNVIVKQKVGSMLRFCVSASLRFPFAGFWRKSNC